MTPRTYPSQCAHECHILSLMHVATNQEGGVGSCRFFMPTHDIKIYCMKLRKKGILDDSTEHDRILGTS